MSSFGDLQMPLFSRGWYQPQSQAEIFPTVHPGLNTNLELNFPEAVVIFPITHKTVKTLEAIM